MAEKLPKVCILYCPFFRNGEKAKAKLYVTENIQGTHRFYLTKIEEATRAMGADVEIDNIAPRAKRTAGDTSSKMRVAEIFAFVKEHDADYQADSSKPVRFKPKPVNPVLLKSSVEDDTASTIPDDFPKNPPLYPGSCLCRCIWIGFMPAWRCSWVWTVFPCLWTWLWVYPGSIASSPMVSFTMMTVLRIITARAI